MMSDGNLTQEIAANFRSERMAYWEYSKQDALFVLSDAVCKQFGIDLAPVKLGLLCQQFVFPSPDTLHKQLEGILGAGLRFSLRLAYSNSQNELCWCIFSGEPHPVKQDLLVGFFSFADNESQVVHNQAENALLKTVLNSSTSGIYVLNHEFKIVFLNPMALAQVRNNWSKEAKQGDDFLSYVPETSLVNVKALFAQVLQGEEVKYEREVILPNGSKRWFQLSYSPICVVPNVVDGILISVVDIDDTKKNTEKLLVQTTLLKSIFENSVDALFFVSQEGKTIIDCSHKALKMFGYSEKSELVGSAGGSNLHAEPMKPEESAVIFESLLKYGAWQGQFWYKRKDGSKFFGKIAIHKIQIEKEFYQLVRIVDATEEYLQQNQLTQTLDNAVRDNELLKEHLQAIGQSANICILNAKAEIMYANINLEEASGFSSTALLGRSLDFLLSKPKDAKSYMALVQKIALGEHWRGTVEMRNKKGSKIWVETVIVSFWIEAENEIRYYCLSVDVSERVFTENQLRIEKSRYESAAETARFYWWEWDIPSNTARFSEHLFPILGYDKDEFPRELSYLDALIHPEDADYVERECQDFLKNKRVEYAVEYRLRKKDNSFMWFLDRGSIVQYADDGSPLLMTGALFDIDVQKKKEAALREAETALRLSQRILNKAQSMAKLGIWSYDVLNKASSFSDELYEIFGFEKSEELSLVKVLKLVVSEDKRRVTKKFREFLSEPKPLDLEFTIQLNNGQLSILRFIGEKIFDETQSLTSIIVALMDITKANHIEQSVLSLLKETQELNRILIENEEELNALMMSLDDMVFVMDEKYRYVKILATREDLLIKPKSQMLGKTLSQLLGPERAVEFETALDAVFSTKQSHYMEFQSVKSPSLWLSAKISPVNVSEEKGKKALVLIQDITERKKIEVDLRESKEKAELATKAKSLFLSTMSHEIRTPLNAVIGISHLLLQQNPREDQLVRLKTLKFSAENLLSLINDILDYSKIEAGKLEIEEKSFSLLDLLEGIRLAFAFRAEEKGIQLKFNLDSALPKTLLGSPERISQVLTNLIGNAIKFTEKGKVRVTVELDADSAEECSVFFAIEDTGIGIDAKQQALIFEEFTQANPGISQTFGGTGLGLSISKKILQLLGSSIQLKSEKGQGSTFSFKLTFKKQAYAQESGTSLEHSAEQPRTLENARILLVEDNEINQFVVGQFLKSWNAHYELAKNGLEAVEKINSKGFQLILMDLQMPEMNGYEAASAIRAKEDRYFKEIPIIALTASALIDVQELVRKAGMNDYVTKPFLPEDLFDKIYVHIYGAKKGRPISPRAHLQSIEQHHPLIDKGLIRKAYPKSELMRPFVFNTQQKVEKLVGELDLYTSKDDLKNAAPVAKELLAISNTLKAQLFSLELQKLLEEIQNGRLLSRNSNSIKVLAKRIISELESVLYFDEEI